MRLAAAALAVGIALAPCMAFGQTYPSKPIRMVVPFPPGGTSDAIGRTLGQKLSEAWNQPVIMDNRSGVAGSIGAAATAKAPPDGYTLVVGNVGPVAVNPSIYKSVGYDPVDFTPITLAVTAPQIVVVHPSVPAKTFQEFNALVKRSGKINYGSSGPGSISHLAAELYKQVTKTNMLHVPYKGSALITIALLAGEVDVVFFRHGRCVATRASGEAARTGGDQPQADAARARRAEHGAIRRAGLRDDKLVGHWARRHP